jgi:hypothetical protein
VAQGLVSHRRSLELRSSSSACDRWVASGYLSRMGAPRMTAPALPLLAAVVCQDENLTDKPQLEYIQESGSCCKERRGGRMAVVNNAPVALGARRRDLTTALSSTALVLPPPPDRQHASLGRSGAEHFNLTPTKHMKQVHMLAKQSSHDCLTITQKLLFPSEVSAHLFHVSRTLLVNRAHVTNLPCRSDSGR